MEEENEAFPHSCCDCDAEFISLSALLTHYDSVHISSYGTSTESDQPLLCPYCLRNFTVESNFAAHIALHENEAPLFSCEICTKCFESEELMRFHQGVSLHKCTYCQVLVSKSQLENHLRKHRRSQLYECSTCSAQTSYKEIALHMKIHNSEGGIVSTCDQCAKAFPSRKNYSLHMKRGHDTYTCDICLAVVFNSREEWESHRQIHFAGSFPCFVCNKVFTEAAGLKNHQDICCHHSNGLSKSQIQATMAVVTENCPFCHTILTSRNEMKSHIRSDHMDFIAYQCQHCDEVCFGMQEFLVHMQYSHPNQFKCQLCSLEFSTTDDLDSHLPTHKQIKTVFACEFCETVHKTKESLFSHKLTHSQLQTQPMETVKTVSAGRGQNTAPQHPNYQPISSQEMFNCLVCPQTFNSKDKLDTHIHVFHKKTTPTIRIPIPTTTTLTKITPTSTPEPNVNILYRCKSCNLLFHGDDKFQEHKRKVHQSKTNYNFNFICKPCNLPFKTASELKQHQSDTCVYKNSNASLVYKPYSCSKCHKKFMLEGSVNLHYCTKVVKLGTKKSFKYTPEEDTSVTFVLTIA